MTKAITYQTKQAFTLIELLVAASILSLVILMVSSITNSASTSIQNSQKNIDADVQARVFFDRMAIDIAKMVKHPELDYKLFKQPANPANSNQDNLQAGNDSFAFYSEVSGYFSGATPTAREIAPWSLIGYRPAYDTNYQPKRTVFQRLSQGLGYQRKPETTSPHDWLSLVYGRGTFPAVFDGLPEFERDIKTFGDQVFRMEYTYLLKGNANTSPRLSITPWDTNLGHSTINGFRDVAAIVVAIAILDSTSGVRVLDDLPLVTEFDDAINDQDILERWTEQLNSETFYSGLASASPPIPRDIASRVRVYQRYFYLDN